MSQEMKEIKDDIAVLKDQVKSTHDDMVALKTTLDILMNNHLKHIQDDISDLKKGQNEMKKDQDEMKKDIAEIREAVKYIPESQSASL